MQATAREAIPMDDHRKPRSKNLRTALILLSIVLVFFIGSLVKQALYGG